MNLALFIKLGMVLKKVYRVLAFNQSKFLKSYIDQCTLLRRQSSSDFVKLLWKLFINSVFGKFIEEIRKYLECKILTNVAGVQKWISSPRFSHMKILAENLTVIFLKEAIPLH